MGNYRKPIIGMRVSDSRRSDLGDLAAFEWRLADGGYLKIWATQRQWVEARDLRKLSLQLLRRRKLELAIVSSRQRPLGE